MWLLATAVFTLSLCVCCGAEAAVAPEPALGPDGTRAPRGAFTVRLRRQLIPLHSSEGSVHHKSAYYGEVSIGGPDAQPFQVVFDTGSGHLILPSALCRTETCLEHRRYRRRISRFAQEIDANGAVVSPWQPRDQITVSFGTGEVTGVFVRDQVCLGPVESAGGGATQAPPPGAVGSPGGGPGVNGTWEALQAPPAGHGCVELRMISATHMTQDPFASFAFDGVLGLGLQSLSQAPPFNFMTAAVDAGSWPGQVPAVASVFAVFLGRESGEESEITFGGWRAERVLDGASGFAWCDVRDAGDGYWQLEVHGISVVEPNGQRRELDFCADGECRAIVDTGTSLLGVPSELGVQLADMLRHRPSPGGGCGGPGPELEVDLGGFAVRLGPEDFSRPEIEAHEDAEGSDEAVEACVPMLMYIDLPPPMSPRTLILGEPVLQKYYTAFDTAGPRVGFVLAKHEAPDAPLHISL